MLWHPTCYVNFLRLSCPISKRKLYLWPKAIVGICNVVDSFLMYLNTPMSVKTQIPCPLPCSVSWASQGIISCWTDPLGTWMTPGTWIPHWLMSLFANTVLPGCMWSKSNQLDGEKYMRNSDIQNKVFVPKELRAENRVDKFTCKQYL